VLPPVLLAEPPVLCRPPLLPPGESPSSSPQALKESGIASSATMAQEDNLFRIFKPPKKPEYQP
jgi:hypothetical protein